MEQTISNSKLEISSDYFSSQKILPPELYNAQVPIELKSEKPLNGKQYLLAIPITKYFSNLPIDSQLGALQSGYKSVSTQFGQLAGQVGGTDSPLVTIKVLSGIVVKSDKAPAVPIG